LPSNFLAPSGWVMRAGVFDGKKIWGQEDECRLGGLMPHDQDFIEREAFGSARSLHPLSGPAGWGKAPASRTHSMRWREEQARLTPQPKGREPRISGMARMWKGQPIRVIRLIRGNGARSV